MSNVNNKNLETEELVEKCNVWRLQTKTNNELNESVANYCFENEILAMGWSLKDKHLEESTCTLDLIKDREYIDRQRNLIANARENERFEEYEKFVNKNKVYSKIDNVRRLNNISENDFVWMRKDGVYLLGLVQKNSEYKYDSSKKALDMDASNQRTNIKWLVIGGEADIPGIITTSFFRGNTLQRINNDSALKFSKYIANKLHNTIYKIGNLDNSPDSIFDLISPNDCEDIICMWLFKKYGYITIPSTCKSSTPLYECVLINHDKDKSGQNKKNVYIQVKKGEIDLDTEKFKHLDGEVYLFTTKGQIKGKKYENIKILDPKEIYEFIMNSENDNILPEKAIRWREVLMEISK